MSDTVQKAALLLCRAAWLGRSSLVLHELTVRLPDMYHVCSKDCPHTFVAAAAALQSGGCCHGGCST